MSGRLLTSTHPVLLPMLHSVLSATLEAPCGIQEAVTELETPVALTKNAQSARSFCALRTSEDSIRAILRVSVAFQAGGRFQVQRSECQGDTIMSAVAGAALSQGSNDTQPSMSFSVRDIIFRSQRRFRYAGSMSLFSEAGVVRFPRAD
jgi:hypothetical protein